MCKCANLYLFPVTLCTFVIETAASNPKLRHAHLCTKYDFNMLQQICSVIDAGNNLYVLQTACNYI